MKNGEIDVMKPYKAPVGTPKDPVPIDLSYDAWRLVRKIQEIEQAKWVTQKGQVLSPSEMNNPHLLNAIKFMEKKARAEIEGMVLSMPDDKDWAQDIQHGFFLNGGATEEEVQDYLAESPVYIALVLEALRRGLIIIDERSNGCE